MAVEELRMVKDLWAKLEYCGAAELVKSPPVNLEGGGGAQDGECLPVQPEEVEEHRVFDVLPVQVLGSRGS